MAARGAATFLEMDDRVIMVIEGRGDADGVMMLLIMISLEDC